MNRDRLDRQIRFLVEIDKLKSVYRRTYLIHEDRHENDAEHSWHLALYAILLAEYAKEDIDTGRVIMMVVIHDLVEIIAGDTYIYDEEGKSTQEEREREAAHTLFSLLPDDQRDTFHALFTEFEAASTPEARFAKAIDRLQPLVHNVHTRGKAWREHNVRPEMVYGINGSIEAGSPSLWEYAREMIREAAEAGLFPKS